MDQKYWIAAYREIKLTSTIISTANCDSNIKWL